MITRGIIIGKIVDDLASLKYQIDTRNKLGYFDLPKFCEDFFREVLNTTYQYNLVNLNQTRNNFPGLDLGDERNGVAFQITSTKISAKINDTLASIKPEQESVFSKIIVFIIGNKQGTYTLDETLCEKYSFIEQNNIKDIDDVLRDIVLLDVDKLHSLHTLFANEFRQVKIELEIVDEKGNFESSYYNVLEKKPSSPPKNGQKYLGDSESIHYDKAYQDLIEVYNQLCSVPRVTREILAIIIEWGVYGPGHFLRNSYAIIPEALERFMRLTSSELLIEVNILEAARLVTIEEVSVGERQVNYLAIKGEGLNYLFLYLVGQKMSIRTLLNTMDFTVLDE